MAGGRGKETPAGIAPAEILQKVPPHNDEAEVAVLGGVLLDSDALDAATELVGPDDFYRDAHQKIFTAMIELSLKGRFDELVLSDHLEGTGRLEAIGGRSYVSSLAVQALSPANVGRYARIVAEKSLVRRLIRAAGEIAAEGYETAGEDVASLIDRAEQAVFEVARRTTRAGFVSMEEVADESYRLIEERRRNRDRGISGVPSGFAKLDTLTNGFQPGDLVILAARPAMGKTSFALNIAEHVGVAHERPVAVFSLEMSREQLGIRMLCSSAEVDQSSVRKGFVGDREVEKLAIALDVLRRAPIYIDDSPVLDLLELRSKARRLKADKGLDLVLIDYLQLIRPTPGRRYDSREREVAEISRGLKQLAKELRLPVVVLAQLNRQVEATADKRPSLSHLRESGALEQDADLVMFLYRKEVYFPDEPELKGKAELILAKHRNGPIDVVGLQFAAKQMKFHDLADEDPYRPGPVPPPGYGTKVDDEVPF